MAQIIVTVDQAADEGEAAVMWRERITLADLQSEHFQAQLVERLGWAVEDASAVETAARSVAMSEDADAEREAEGGYRRSASVVTTAS